MTKNNILKLALVLEQAGCEGYALRLITEDIIPLAKDKGQSALWAMREYADGSQEQDTSWYQLHEALVQAHNLIEAIEGITDPA